MKKPALVFLFLIFGATLFAQDLTLPQLNQKVRELENRVKILERLLALQGAQPAGSGDSAAPAAKEAWRKLKQGMSREQVRKLLGDPDQVAAYGDMTYWRISGSVIMFDESGLFSWTEPGK